MSQSYILPDTLKDWPWPRRIGPYYEEIKQECDAWIHQFNVFDENAQRAFDKCNFGSQAVIFENISLITAVAVLLAALSNPTHDKGWSPNSVQFYVYLLNVTSEHLWTCAANMIAFFVFDEYTDVQDAAGTEALANIVMDALKHPHSPRPKEENIIGELFRV